MADDTRGEIVSLHGDHVPGRTDDRTIEVLRTLLAKAERGEVIGIAYTVALGDRGNGTGWEGAVGTRWPLAAGISTLFHRYNHSMIVND